MLRHGKVFIEGLIDWPDESAIVNSDNVGSAKSKAPKDEEQKINSTSTEKSILKNIRK